MNGKPPSSPLDRRAFLAGVSAAAGSLFLARRVHGAGEPAEAADRASQPLPRGAFRFVVINDVHHAGPECDPFFEQLVAQIRTHRDVAFCLIVGDLADKGQPASLAAVKRAFGQLGIPVHTVPGNHDNDVAGDTSLYAATFPDGLNSNFTHRRWQFIGLDSTEGYNWGDTHISPTTLEYLETIVPTLDPKAPTVVFTHFPLGAGIRLRPVNADAVLDRLAPLTLRAAFCGHFHSRTLVPLGAALLTTNVCCSRVRGNHDGTRREGYLVCTADRDGRLVQDFVEFVPASQSPEMPPGLAG